MLGSSDIGLDELSGAAGDGCVAEGDISGRCTVCAVAIPPKIRTPESDAVINPQRKLFIVSTPPEQLRVLLIVRKIRATAELLTFSSASETCKLGVPTRQSQVGHFCLGSSGPVGQTGLYA